MMKKQLQKFKLGVENLSRPSKPDKNSEELLAADLQVERYKDVLEKIVKKFAPLSGSGVSLPGSGSSSNSGGSNNHSGGGGANGDGGGLLDAASREKRCKKLHEWRLAQAMEESMVGLPDGLLKDVLSNCARLERNIANEIVDNEQKVEQSVTRKLTEIVEKHLASIQKQKRIVTKLMQDKESAKYKHQAAIRVNESAAKIAQLREEQDECESKLEKERDIWATEMFELIAEEDKMANYIVNYVTAQRLYYKSSLEQIEETMTNVDGLIRGSNKRTFKVPLDEHLKATDRKIAHVIEMCVCCLLERGLNEEGLLRVGCAGSKLRRFRTAIDANLAQPPLTAEYNDVHVIAGLLKSYLRDLPEPLLTFRLYDEFVAATRRSTEDQCKRAILNAVNQLPAENYMNLRYLTKFLAILAENSGRNKMSAQNIAIVMSPNLLWSPNSDADMASDGTADYLQIVNSSTAVNRIVELMIGDWSFFFDGHIEFYQTLRPEDLFRENMTAGSALTMHTSTHAHTAADISEPYSINMGMTKSMNAAIMSNNELVSSVAATTAAAAAKPTTTAASGNGGGHSRSNSHDTSLILLSSHLDQSKRSQSNSSLSDASSPPGQNSPKLPVRRKHNKQVAPTPPDTRFANADTTFRHEYDEHHSNNHQTNNHHQQNIAKPMAAVRHVFESNDSLSNQSTNTTAARPDKPPRPSFGPAECQTLNRAQYRSAKEASTSTPAAASATGSGHAARPSALPKGMLFANRSTENLSDKNGDAKNSDGGDTSPIQLREKFEPTPTGPSAALVKPAIPDRPMSLMRPMSFKTPGGAAAVAAAAASSNQPDHHHQFAEPMLKKTGSFRGPSNANGNGNNGKASNGQTTLERTHIYNVDKKQVAIIDFVDSNSGSKAQTTTSDATPNNVSHPTTTEASIVTATLKITPASSTVTMPATDATTATAPPAVQTTAANANNGSHTTLTLSTSAPTPTVSAAHSTHGGNVPPSPRGFDPKIKRPQIPAPPPPTTAAAGIRPKSESGDSTNL